MPALTRLSTETAGVVSQAGSEGLHRETFTGHGHAGVPHPLTLPGLSHKEMTPVPRTPSGLCSAFGANAQATPCHEKACLPSTWHMFGTSFQMAECSSLAHG